jgi:poly(A) polymerase
MNENRLKSLGKELLCHPAVKRVGEAVPRERRKDLYLVGGALRDFWLGRSVSDFDFVVQGDAVALAGEAAGKLSARLVVLDEQWGVVRLICGLDGSSGDRVSLDFAAMQGEEIREDLERRDFTCNAMALCLDPGGGGSGKQGWLDPTGGLNDLQGRTIRMVDPSAFREDPLRMLRAFRLGCSLGFRIDPSTQEVIRTECEEIRRPAGERIGEELVRLLGCVESFPYIEQMDRCGLLAALFPETRALKGLTQGGHHHLDGWNHTLETFRLLEISLGEGLQALSSWLDGQPRTRAMLKYAALFHDLGKPGALTRDPEGGIHFYGHDREGALTAVEILERVRASRNDRGRVRNWVRYHMGPVHMTQAFRKGKLTEKARIRFLRRVGPDAIGVLLLSLADVGASRGSWTEPGWKKSYMELVDSLFTLCIERDAVSRNVRPLLSGKDLMAALDLEPGPRVGQLLRLLEEARIEGKIRDRDGALELAASIEKKLSSEITSRKRTPDKKRD